MVRRGEPGHGQSVHRGLQGRGQRHVFHWHRLLERGPERLGAGLGKGQRLGVVHVRAGDASASATDLENELTLKTTSL